MSQLMHNLANRVRLGIGRAALPKRCCRQKKNMGPVVQEGPDSTYWRCRVCDCRHFEQVIDAGQLGIKTT